MKFFPLLVFTTTNALWVFPRVTLAAPLESIIAPHFGTIFVNETRLASANKEVESKGYRYTLRTDFMSLPNHVSINLTGSRGADYWDVGAQFRLFDYATLRDLGSSGVIYGMGAGLNFSTGYNEKVTTPPSSPFKDIIVTAYTRFQFDTQKDWGLFFETAYEAIILRSFSKSASLDKAISHRFLLTAGVPFEFSNKTRY
jgi:hypothetical protein